MSAALTILPIFALIILGYGLARGHWLDNHALTGLTTITFKLFMPVLLFAGIARASLSEGLSPTLLLAYYLPLLGVFLGVNLLTYRRQKKATPTGLAAGFSNNVLVGIPLISSLLGSDALIYVFAILVFHSLTLFSLHSFYAAFGGQEPVSGRALLKSLANPLIIGLLLGALLNISGVQLGTPLWRIIDWLGQAALPCALLVLGASLAQYRLRPERAAIALAGVKLLLFPALVWWFSGLFDGLGPTARMVLVLMAANPTGVNVLAFARTPEDTQLISSTVFLSTVVSALTLPMWAYILSVPA